MLTVLHTDVRGRAVPLADATRVAGGPKDRSTTRGADVKRDCVVSTERQSCRARGARLPWRERAPGCRARIYSSSSGQSPLAFYVGQKYTVVNTAVTCAREIGSYPTLEWTWVLACTERGPHGETCAEHTTQRPLSVSLLLLGLHHLHWQLLAPRLDLRNLRLGVRGRALRRLGRLVVPLLSLLLGDDRSAGGLLS